MSEQKNVSRVIQPLGPRVLIRLVDQGDRHESGLYLPAGSRERMSEALFGEVIEVARAQPGTSDDLGTNVSGIPCGARVLFPKDAGVSCPWDDKLRLLEVTKVLALVEEIPIDETH